MAVVNGTTISFTDTGSTPNLSWDVVKVFMTVTPTASDTIWNYRTTTVNGNLLILNTEGSVPEMSYHNLLSSSSSVNSGNSGGANTAICHNGNTLNVNINALQAHLNHGDTEGACR